MEYTYLPTIQEKLPNQQETIDRIDISLIDRFTQNSRLVLEVKDRCQKYPSAISAENR